MRLIYPRTRIFTEDNEESSLAFADRDNDDGYDNEDNKVLSGG